jgi:1-acyl-sn-glycerol-3-phosphate acyltransferase
MYRFGRFMLKLHYMIWHGLKIVNSDKVPRDSGVIVASNHISHLDPPAVGIAIPRISRFVAKDELFHQFFLSWFFPRVGVIPIKRGGGGKDMLDKAADVLKEGGLITMFPEGTRSKTGHPGRPRTGMIVLAAMADVPIVPARISGSYDCMPPGSLIPLPGRIQVVFGDPIKWQPGELDLNNRDQMVDQARHVMDVILELPGWHPRKAKPLESEAKEQAADTGDKSR